MTLTVTALTPKCITVGADKRTTAVVGNQIQYKHGAIKVFPLKVRNQDCLVAISGEAMADFGVLLKTWIEEKLNEFNGSQLSAINIQGISFPPFQSQDSILEFIQYLSVQAKQMPNLNTSNATIDFSYFNVTQQNQSTFIRMNTAPLLINLSANLFVDISIYQNPQYGFWFSEVSDVADGIYNNINVTNYTPEESQKLTDFILKTTISCYDFKMSQTVGDGYDIWQMKLGEEPVQKRKGQK